MEPRIPLEPLPRCAFDNAKGRLKPFGFKRPFLLRFFSFHRMTSSRAKHALFCFQLKHHMVRMEIIGSGRLQAESTKGSFRKLRVQWLWLWRAHICLFTTGCGSPLGNAASVTIKISANPDTNRRMGAEMIDLDASAAIAEGVSISDMGAQLYEKAIEIAQGALCKAEIVGDFSWITPPCGTI